MSAATPEFLFGGRVIETRGDDSSGQTTVVLESVNDEGDAVAQEVTLPTADYQAYLAALESLATDQTAIPQPDEG